MQNEKNKTYDLKIKKTIPLPAKKIFEAIGEGKLFLNCSAGSETLKIDFRVGGKYEIDFMSFNMSNHGEFLEINPYDKIVFTWCQGAQKNLPSDTKVTILLEEESGKTNLSLTHEGFKSEDAVKDHTQGWNGGLDDLFIELQSSRLRITRYYDTPLENLYQKLSEPSKFFKNISVKILEQKPKEKIIFSLEDSKVTLLFEEDEDNTSWAELIHENLGSSSEMMDYRKSWDSLFEKTRAELKP